MQSNLFSVDDPAKGNFDLLFTSSESSSGRYGCESVEATHTAEVAVLGKRRNMCSVEERNSDCHIFKLIRHAYGNK